MPIGDEGPDPITGPLREPRHGTERDGPGSRFVTDGGPENVEDGLGRDADGFDRGDDGQRPAADVELATPDPPPMIDRDLREPTRGADVESPGSRFVTDGGGEQEDTDPDAGA